MPGRRTIWMSLLLLLLLLVAPALPPAPAAAAPPEAPGFAEIRPELELFAGVLAWSGWPHGAPVTQGNRYFQALKAYLEPYRDHEAVQVYKELLQTYGFAWDAPPAFIFHLGPLPDLELVHEYSSYLITRAGGRENLERLRLALKDLAADSQFSSFVTQWQPHYETWIRTYPFNGARLTGWLERFFGGSAQNEFHMVLAPGLLRGGGYGITVTAADGQQQIYEVARENGTSEGDPTFQDGLGLEMLALHEWGHAFVNPALAEFPMEVLGLKPLFDPVAKQMADQAYPSVQIFANELVLRGACALAARELYGEGTYARSVSTDLTHGFYQVGLVADILKEYQANRAKYPAFTDFVPVLLDRLTRAAGVVEVRSEMELLAGVLTASDWDKQHGPQAKGNLYYQALEAHMAPFREHEAVTLYNQMLKQGFAYNYPPAFVLHLGPLPDLEVRYEYPADLVQKAGGRENLERFRLALKDLAAKSAFGEFLADWKQSLTRMQQAAIFDAGRVTGWLEEFFGETGRMEYRLVLAPALFPAGGYGATVTAPDGKQTVYQIVRAESAGEGMPVLPKGAALEDLALHEWGHAFVNPALEARPDLVRRLTRHYRPVREAMEQQAYGTVQAFANEQVLRAVTALAAEELGGKEADNRAVGYAEERSFYLTGSAVALLRQYRADRSTYPTFASFVPNLLEQLAEREPAPGGAQPVWPWALGGGAGLAAVAGWQYRRRATRARACPGSESPAGPGPT